jgi:hypothetical protein
MCPLILCQDPDLGDGISRGVVHSCYAMCPARAIPVPCREHACFVVPALLFGASWPLLAYPNDAGSRKSLREGGREGGPCEGTASSSSCLSRFDIIPLLTLFLSLSLSLFLSLCTRRIMESHAYARGATVQRRFGKHLYYRPPSPVTAARQST